MPTCSVELFIEPHPRQHGVLLHLNFLDDLVSVNWYLIVVSISSSTSLIANEAEDSFTFLLTVHNSSSEISFFFFGLLSTFLLSCVF